MSLVVELEFPLLASAPIPADHGYLLYAAVSRLLPEVHQPNHIALCPISGRQLGNRLLALTRTSRLRLRSPQEQVPLLVHLAGKELQLGQARLTVGTPCVQLLQPAEALRSRLVVIKVKDAPRASDLNEKLFAQAARRQLDQLGISAQVQLQVGKRRTLRLERREIVGYELAVHGLSDEESLTLQQQGLGGRRHMGCGVFVPLQNGASHDE